MGPRISSDAIGRRKTHHTMAKTQMSRQLSSQCDSSILVHKSSSKPPLRTYSKRVLQDTSAPPSKRQRTEHPETTVQSTVKSGVLPSTPPLPRKRSISDYFEPLTSSRTPSSPLSSVFSTDTLEKNIESPPSSPSSPEAPPSRAPPRKRAKRRLIARAPLASLKMSDLNAGSSKRHKKRKGNVADKGPFYPGSPPRTPYLTKTSEPGLRQAARGGTTSDEEEEDAEDEDDSESGEDAGKRVGDDIPRSSPIDIPGARNRSPEKLIIPFAPGRPYIHGGLLPSQSSTSATHRQITSDTPHTLLEGPTTGSSTAVNSGNTLIPSASALTQNTMSNQTAVNREGNQTSAAQTNDADAMIRMNPVGTVQNENLAAIAELESTQSPFGIAPQAMVTQNQPPSTLHNLGPSTQSHVAGSAVVLGSANPTLSGVIQPNVPASSNAAQNPPTSTQTNPGMLTQSHVAGPAVAQAPVIPAIGGVIQPNVTAPGNVTNAPNLVQSQLAIGTPIMVTCNFCKFVYNRTLQADNRTHMLFHNNYALGESVGSLTPDPPHHIESIFTGIGQGDYVATVDRSSTNGWKNLALVVLGRVDRELGALPISANVLWSSIPDPEAAGQTTMSNMVNRFQVFMYMRRYTPAPARVISLLLAERVTKGFETRVQQIEADEFGPWPSIVPQTETIVSDSAREAVLGVNKFWTLPNCRRNGYGKKLLDLARRHFIGAYVIPRIHVAYTATTDDGAAFATRYMNDQANWDFLTYDDQM